jgi:hypothetical protein
VRAVRHQPKPRLNEPVSEATDKPVKVALGISGRCREFRQRNDPSVPLVQRRKEPPFCRRQLLAPRAPKDKREVLAIYTRIGIHQIGGRYLSAAASTEARPGPTSHKPPLVIKSIFFDFDDGLF